MKHIPTLPENTAFELHRNKDQTRLKQLPSITGKALDLIFCILVYVIAIRIYTRS